MAVIRDVMPAFQLYQPSSVADAQKLLEQNGDDALVLAGGLDSMDWLKDRIKKPRVVVDLGGVDELKGIRETADGVEIGAMTTLTEVARNPVIRGKYGVLAQAAELVASPQMRRLALLSRGRKHLLCGHPGGQKSRACHSARRTMCGCESLRHGARPDCTGCQVRRDDSERPAGSPGRRLLRRA